jgi:hypothetical protein
MTARRIATMITSKHAMRGVSLWLIGCLFAAPMVLRTTPAASEGSANTSTDTNALVEVMTEAGAPTRLSKGYFANNSGCVSAKLDIWFTRGRHSHHLFTVHAEETPGAPQSPGEPARRSRQAGEGDKTNPAFYDVMDADGTTIFIGGDGCRFRVRIDKAE